MLTKIEVRVVWLSSFACLTVALGLAQSSSHRELIRQIQQLDGAQAMINMPSVAPLFLEDNQFSSTLYIVNEGNAPTAGRLLLLTIDGHLILDRRIPVGGHDKAEIRLKPLLASVGSIVTQGSLELFDDNVEGSALVGEVVVTYHDHAISSNIDEELLMPTMSHSHELRGLAVGAAADPVVGVSSTSDQPVDVEVSCSGERGETMRKSFQIPSTKWSCFSPAPIDSALLIQQSCLSSQNPNSATLKHVGFEFTQLILGPRFRHLGSHQSKLLESLASLPFRFMTPMTLFQRRPSIQELVWATKQSFGETFVRE